MDVRTEVTRRTLVGVLVDERGFRNSIPKVLSLHFVSVSTFKKHT